MNLPPLAIDVSFITENKPLPDGRVIKSEKQSMIELETNIRTLGQLYRTLSDLKKQLPSPVLAAVENNTFQSLSSTVAAGHSNSSLLLKRKSTDYGAGIPITPIDQEQAASSFITTNNLFNKYPSFIFEALIELHLTCTCTPSWRDTSHVMEAFRVGNLTPSLMHAIFAYNAMHGITCHSEQFNQPYLIPLAEECYRLACDFLEFDNMTISTVETLALLHLYTTLRCLQSHHLYIAKRHMSFLGYDKNWNLHAWLRRMDLATTLDTNFSCSLPSNNNNNNNNNTDYHHHQDDYTDKYTQLKKPNSKKINHPHHQNQQQQQQNMNPYIFPSPAASPLSISLTSFSDDLAYQDRLWIYYEIKGWELIHKKGSIKEFQKWVQESISDIYEKNRQSYMNDTTHPHNNSNSSKNNNDMGNEAEQISRIAQYRILRLQALYLSGILNNHQSEMMDAFASDDRWVLDDQCTDYFSVTFKNQNTIQQTLHNCMSAAFKLIQVVLTLFQIKHKCLIPELIDILTAACTIIYFGHKVASDPNITRQASQALHDIVFAFENERYMIIALPKISSSLNRWKSMINSF